MTRICSRICIALAIGLVFSTQQMVLSQVVQLPSVRNFSYSGSAWVPDAGTGSLASNRYSRSGSSSRGFGPYAARSGGKSRGGSSLVASTQIIDLKALDDAILSANVDQSKGLTSVLSAGSPAAGGRNYLSGLSSGPYAGSRQMNPDPGQWQRAMSGGSRLADHRHQSIVEADIRFYLLRGKEAEAANRLNSAQVFYRMAIEAMTPEMVERYHSILEQRKKAEEEKKKVDQTAGRKQF